MNNPELMTGAVWALITIGMLLVFLILVIILVFFLKHLEKQKKKKQQRQTMEARLCNDKDTDEE